MMKVKKTIKKAKGEYMKEIVFLSVKLYINDKRGSIINMLPLFLFDLMY